MKFWDSSALVALVVDEEASGRVRSIGSDDDERVVWVLTEVEAASGLWRRRRANEMTENAREIAQRGVDLMLANAAVVTEVSAVASRARRVLAAHSLRAGDALQLAAALIACEEDPSRLPLVTLDDRLAEAAVREGFTVLR